MHTTPEIQLTTANTAEAAAWLREALAIDNTAEVQIDGSHTSQAISLNFPKFTDGRAYSQAALLRGRLGATGPKTLYCGGVWGLQALLSRPAMYWLTRFCKWLDVVSAMPFCERINRWRLHSANWLDTVASTRSMPIR